MAVQEENETKKQLYPYQKEAVDKIFSKLGELTPNENILFQLPTGGGKTVIFSEISRKFIEKFQKKVLILTHRIELSVQTSHALADANVRNMVISSEVREIPDQEQYDCFTAMVETLNNRLYENDKYLEGVGLVIVDEAHYNSFRKIFHYFDNVNILGVTATPLSSNKRLPLKDNYHHLIVGESIASLIDKGYLSEATTYTYDVNLQSLRVGINGDFTVGSMDALYGGFMMQDKLVKAYEEKSIGKKTLIFNSGIITSRKVCKMFETKGYNVRHLDSTYSDGERKSVLDWFKNTKDAILTSVGILTTGFDEPSVETIILNRATRSLTLYHQMIGRGSRRLPNKSLFTIIDLGNNSRRFGLWQEKINWQNVFVNPDRYLDGKFDGEDFEERELEYIMPDDVRKRLGKTPEDMIELDMQQVYLEVTRAGHRSMEAINEAIKHHAVVIGQNARFYEEGLELVEVLQDQIEYYIRQYTKCISKSTENYFKWLMDEYNRKLKHKLKFVFPDYFES